VVLVAVSRRLRYEILRRDNHTCRYCGGSAPDVALTVDHVIPTALGGTDDPTNLVTACQPCNAGKSASAPDAPLVADVAADALRWAQAMHYAASQMAEERDLRNAWHEEFEDAWNRWKTHEGKGDPLPLPDDWRDSLNSFLNARVPWFVVDDAIDIAMRRRGLDAHSVFRYMCGVIWRKADEQREKAAQRVAALDSPWDARGGDS
jgi:hypothetical protein